VRPEQADRLATNYGLAQTATASAWLDDAATSAYLHDPVYLSGGGGLVSTAGDTSLQPDAAGKGSLDGTGSSGGRRWS